MTRDRQPENVFVQMLIRQVLGSSAARRSGTALYLAAIALAIAGIASAWDPAHATAIVIAIAGLCALTTVPAWPLGGLLVYVGVVHGFPRYTTGVEFMFAHFVPELIASLTAAGTVLWLARRQETRAKANRAPAVLMLCFVGWSLLSAAYWLFTSDNWLDLQATFDLKHHPGRLVNAGLLMFTATVATRSRQDVHTFALFTGALLIVKWMLFAADIKLRPADFAALGVIVLPLCLAVSTSAEARWFRVTGTAISLALVALVLAAANRGATVALVIVLFVILAQIRSRRLLLLIGLPALAVAIIGLQTSGVGQRFGRLFDGTTAAGDAGVSERLALWRAAPHVIGEHWFIGVGPGRSPAYIAQHTPAALNSDYAVHNNFLAVATELGVPGLLLYGALFGSTVILMWQKGRTSAQHWPAPEARALVASIIAYLAVGMFITRHDQALPYILLGFATAVSAYFPHHDRARHTRAAGSGRG